LGAHYIGVHSAHGDPHDEAGACNVEMGGGETVCCADHVRVLVAREAGAKSSVAGLAGVAVANGVWEEDEIFVGIEGLAWVEENAGKLIVEELFALAG